MKTDKNSKRPSEALQIDCSILVLTIIINFVVKLLVGEYSHFLLLLTCISAVGMFSVALLAVVKYVEARTDNSFDDLKNLAQLKEQGVISEEEFSKMKSELLRKI